MKLLHVYDHTYYEKDGQFYSSGAFGANTWEMYLGYFDHITVLSNLNTKPTDGLDFSKFDVSSRHSVDFKFIKNYRLAGNYVKGFFKAVELENTIKAHDAIVIRLPSELGLFAVQAAKKLNKPYAIEVVGCAWDSYWYHGSLVGAVMAPVTFNRMKSAIKNAPFVIYVTEHFLQNRYPTNGFGYYASDVIIPPVDNKILEHRIEKIENRSGKIKIGLAGTLNVKYKGHLEALKALSLVKSKIPEFELLFIGKGDPAWINNTISDIKMEGQAKVLGKISGGDEVFKFFDDLDLYLHPSKHEGLPRVVIEAMSRACPILASSIAGIPQLLPQKFLHKPGHYKTLSVQIEKTLNNKALMIEMAAENFKNAQTFNLQETRAKQKVFWEKFRDYAKNN